MRVTIGCLALSGVVLGSLAVQKISTAQATQQNQAQAQAQKQQAEQQQAEQQRQLQTEQERQRLESLADSQRRAAIEANAEGWRLWQAHIDPKCSVTISKLDRHRSYLGSRISKKRLVYEGLIVCDKDYVGILKGADLKPAWMVPRTGSRYPMPSTPPPPEFQPPSPSTVIQN